MTTTLSSSNSGDSVVGSCVEHVERGAGDAARRDGVGQRRLVDDAAAGDVDDPQARLGRGEHLARRSARSFPWSSGRWIVRKSASATTLFEAAAARRAAGAPARRSRTGRGHEPHAERLGTAGRRARRCGRGRRCRASCRAARRPPTCDRSQRPALSAAWAWGTLRACASSSAIVCSAADTMFDCGAFTTITPRRVAASTSTLSRPIPARPTTTSVRPACSTSAVDLRSPSGRSARRAPTDARRAARRVTDRAGRRPVCPAARSRSSPPSAISSVTEGTRCHRRSTRFGAVTSGPVAPAPNRAPPERVPAPGAQAQQLGDAADALDEVVVAQRERQAHVAGAPNASPGTSATLASFRITSPSSSVVVGSRARRSSGRARPRTTGSSRTRPAVRGR